MASKVDISLSLLVESDSDTEAVYGAYKALLDTVQACSTVEMIRADYFLFDRLPEDTPK